MNKLIVIGTTGNKRCYLNVDPKTAVERWLEAETSHFNDEAWSKQERIALIDSMKRNEVRVEAFEFEDEFAAYDAWSHYS